MPPYLKQSAAPALAGKVSAAQAGLKGRAELNKPPGAPQLTAPAGQTKPLRQPSMGGMVPPTMGRNLPMSSAGTPMQGMQSATSGGFTSNSPMQASAPGLQAQPGLRPNLQRQVDAGTMTPWGAANRNAMFHAGQLPGQQMDGGGYGSQAPPMPGPQQGPAGYQSAGQQYGQIPPEMMQRLQGNQQNAGQMGYPGGAQQMPPQQMQFLQSMRQDPRFAQMLQNSPPNLGMYYGQ